MKTFTTGDGVRLAWREDGEGPPLLLLGSLGTTGGMWAAQVAPLGARRRLIRLDMRGHGGSEAPSGAYTMERLGRDALELLDHLGIGRADLCGLSIGGMIATWVCAHAPARVGRAVLANSAAHMGPPSAWDDRLGAVRAGGVAAIADGVVERWFTPGFRAARPEAVEPIRAMLLGCDPAGYAGCCAAIRDMDQRALLPQVAAPTLVIGGAADPATPPAKAEELASGVPRAHLAMLDAAHLSNIEAADAFNAAVFEHLG